MEEAAAQAETRPLGSVSDAANELANENAQLRAELHIRTAVYNIESRLAKAGARTPNLIAASAKEQFQFDDKGTLNNAEAVVDHLRRTYPEQFAVSSIDASAGRTPRPTITKEALARMKPEEIQRLDWAEVRAALSA
jgi:isopentenyl diphosphate isomerase/L-lactate dehydrogenase-like FMN-dependent dehydrogenase